MMYRLLTTLLADVSSGPTVGQKISSFFSTVGSGISTGASATWHGISTGAVYGWWGIKTGFWGAWSGLKASYHWLVHDAPWKLIGEYSGYALPFVMGIVCFCLFNSYSKQSLRDVVRKPREFRLILNKGVRVSGIFWGCGFCLFYIGGMILTVRYGLP